MPSTTQQVDRLVAPSTHAWADSGYLDTLKTWLANNRLRRPHPRSQTTQDGILELTRLPPLGSPPLYGIECFAGGTSTCLLPPDKTANSRSLPEG